jgi:hypothetical protein
MNLVSKRIFTGQFVDDRENVTCPVCLELVNVRRGWIDPYNKGRYVHFECLSQRRKDEVAEERSKDGIR